MSYLLDTNAVSELRPSRTRPIDAGLAAWMGARDSTELHITAITALELEIGVQRKARVDAAAGARLRRWLDEILRAFEGRVLGFDLAGVAATAPLHVPDPRPLADSLIAGIARAHGLAVVTRNVRDFQELGVEIVSPWRGD